MKQMHQKDREDQEEELEDIRQSCQKRVCERRGQPRPWALMGPALFLFPRVKGRPGYGDGALSATTCDLAP